MLAQTTSSHTVMNRGFLRVHVLDLTTFIPRFKACIRAVDQKGATVSRTLTEIEYKR